MQVWYSLGCGPELCGPGCGRIDCDDEESSRAFMRPPRPRNNRRPLTRQGSKGADALLKAERAERLVLEQKERMRAEEAELERRKQARRQAEEQKQREIENVQSEQQEQARKREKERLAEELRLEAEMSSKEVHREAARVSRIYDAVKEMVEEKDNEESPRAKKLQAWLTKNRFKHVNHKKTKWFRRYYYPLHVAVRSNDAEVVELLLANSADMNLLDSSKKTPLQLAQKLHAKKGEYAKVLEALGAPP
mmetsp:Transcript_61250/g.145808  ORF Transcript_61250/g.145808 Transcript_61250/m.145808 type:complete len:249 (-) Transcript_61250:62-808(-)